MASPAKVVRELSPAQLAMLKHVSDQYLMQTQRHRTLLEAGLC